jgi:hypothetical protein
MPVEERQSNAVGVFRFASFEGTHELTKSWGTESLVTISHKVSQFGTSSIKIAEIIRARSARSVSRMDFSLPWI